MKRTELKRKTPMKRTAIERNVKSAMGSRRKPLKPKSQKRKAEDREVNDLEAFAELFVDGPARRNGWYTTPSGLPCWLCQNRPATEINHIAGRSSKLRHHRTNLSAVCSDCHRDIVPVIGVPGMFAFKKLRDPDGFDAAVMRELLRAKGLGNGRAA